MATLPLTGITFFECRQYPGQMADDFIGLDWLPPDDTADALHDYRSMIREYLTELGAAIVPHVASGRTFPRLGWRAVVGCFATMGRVDRDLLDSMHAAALTRLRDRYAIPEVVC